MNPRRKITLYTDTLQEAFLQAGLPFPGAPEPGNLIRFSVNGKHRDKAGWLRLFADGNGASFGCWRDDVEFIWQRAHDRHRKQSEADIARLKAEAQQQKIARQREEAQRHKQIAEQAQTIWLAAPAAYPQHPYLCAKMIPPLGLGQRGNALLVPLVDGYGLVNLQLIYPDGRKRFLVGGKVKGCYSPIGCRKIGILYICEGWATGVSIHLLTGCDVVCAMNCGNLLEVALKLRRLYPSRMIVIAGDDDRFTERNPGKEAADKAARAIGGILVMPTFPEGFTGTDFNDMHQLMLRGLL